MATDLSHLRSWERPRPIIPKNNIISSEWSMSNTIFPNTISLSKLFPGAKKKRPRFLTSYENEVSI